MTTTLLETFRQGIKKLTLIPSGGGVFEVEINGQLIHSKKELHRFPDEKELVKQLIGMGFEEA